MRQEIEQNIIELERQYQFIYNNQPPILMADIEAILFLIVRILIVMLKRELKRLA